MPSGRRGGVKTPPYKSTVKGVPTAKLPAGHARPLQCNKKQDAVLRNSILLFYGIYFSTAPRLALVTNLAYRASQPVLMFGSGWT